MKNFVFVLIISNLLLHVEAQENYDIDSILNQFTITSNAMNSILSEYNCNLRGDTKIDHDIQKVVVNSKLNETKIINEFYSLENLCSIRDFHDTVQFMYSSLNPGYNIDNILSRIDPFLTTKFTEKSNAAKIQGCCNKYIENLDLLSNTIHQYENVPYFCFHAYPRYSNNIVDENLKILNSRIDFKMNGLGYRTQQFLELTELDLSNSNFSMDLLLKDHKNLRKLNLSNTKIHCIENLVELKIEWLNLSNTNIDQRDLVYLRYMPSLDYLNLSNTNLNRMAISELRIHLNIDKKNFIISKRGEDKGKSDLITENSGPAN